MPEFIAYVGLQGPSGAGGGGGGSITIQTTAPVSGGSATPGTSFALSLAYSTGLTVSGGSLVVDTSTIATQSYVATQLGGYVTSASLTTTLAGYVPTTRTLTAGTGLTGGGALSVDRTLSVSFGTTGATACVGNDARLSDARTPSTTGANGAVMCYAGGVWTNSGAGTAGQALLSGGTSAPSWGYATTVGDGTGRVTYQGGARVAQRRLASGDFPYTAAATDYLLVVTTTASARSITLPTTPSDGAAYVVKDGSNGAATNSITVNRGGADVFNSAAANGATSYVISTNGGIATFVYSAAAAIWEVY